ncbi:TM40L protein, partial [Prunella fulvescens]|nr:TM40L protein [Prunella fulvescens]
EVFPPQMEGVKLIVTKTLSSHFQVTHTVHMSTLGPSGYRFNATFVGDRQLGPTEVFPTLLGDMDSCGSLNAQALHLLGERLRAKAVFQDTWGTPGDTRGHLGDTWGTSWGHLGTAGMPWGHLGMPQGHLGVPWGHLGIPWGHLGDTWGHLGVPWGHLGTLGDTWGHQLSVAAPNWVATLNVGYGGAHASYYHRANEQVQVGVELEANTRLQETSFAFGYQLSLPRANVVFRGGRAPRRCCHQCHLLVALRCPRCPPAGLLDSNWSVGGVLEKKLLPLPVTLALGAFLNHWRSRFHCGFSVTVG